MTVTPSRHTADAPKKARRRRWPVVALLLVLSLAVGAAALVVVPLYRLPLPTGFAEPPRAATRLATADGDVFASRGALRGREIAIEDLPRHLIDAVLAMEDRRFYEHAGLDWRGILRAGIGNVREGAVRQGGSTITQQLVKNSFLTPERSWLRKLQEALIALWLERRLTKDEILRRYLSSVYLGAGAHGVDAAAQRYFAKAARDLTLAESAMLAGLIQAPSRHTPLRAPEEAARRAGIVLDAMVATGAITPEQAAEAKASPAQLALPVAVLPGSGWFADHADGEARRLLGDVIGAFTVRTTLDAGLQAHAERVVGSWLAGEARALGVTEAALVALAPDGAVLAMVGGRDYGDSQFNRAVQARRQPGSLFKLFVYLAALEAGYGPDSPVLDAPVQVGDWQPGNYGNRYVGQTDLRTAFAQSLNSAAVRLSEEVGRDRVIALARAMGVTGPLPPHPSLALGTAEVSLLEMTAAYAAVAAGTRSVEPYAVQAVEGPGSILYVRPPAPATPPSWPQAAALDLLSAVVREGTGRHAALDRPVFGKTGTTQEHRDAWFVGFVDGLVVGVWVGNDDNTPMDAVTGGSLPARIWADFVSGAPLPPPGGPGLPEPAYPADVATFPQPEPLVPLPDVLPAPAPLPEPAPPPASYLVGVPVVHDTGTLEIAGHIVRLDGVEGVGGIHARNMADYIGGRDVVCVAVRADRHRCEVDGWDLSEVVLFNGGGYATDDAPAELRTAEAQARAAGFGIWGVR